MPAKEITTAAIVKGMECLHELLQARARSCPDAIAVECDGESLTYGELDARANQLARVLRQSGVHPESLVGICLERSPQMMVALLGILKAGGAYVPLDPAHPAERIHYVLQDANLQILLTQRSIMQSLPLGDCKPICLDADWTVLRDIDSSRVETAVAADNLAYVIYTSGSTGKPKGVEIEHRNVVNLLRSMQQTPGLNSNDTLLAVATLSFDMSVPDMFLPLLVGARLVLASREAARDGRLLRQLLEQCRATVMTATPVSWQLLFDAGWRGSTGFKVMVGGEAVPVDLARRLAGCCGSVWNMYGPTETTVWSSGYRVGGREDKLVPIGKPIANTTLHILDEHLRPVAEGAAGELYIGGAGVARGYHNRPELTAQKFVPDPINSGSGARLYRTGDLVRYRQDGNVEFVGRADNQVKIRGFRVELGEIEAVLEQHPAVRQAIVQVHDDPSGQRRLVAHIVPHSGGAVTREELCAFASKQLPDYMLPSALVERESMPLTPNGKVDRKALSPPESAVAELHAGYLAPRDATERKLVRIWEQVLGIRPIGIATSFFDLGGSSIVAARMFIRISRAFGKDLPLVTLLHAPTVEQLAKHLRPDSRTVGYATLAEIQPKGSAVPFFCVHGGAGTTLFLHRLARALGNDQPLYGFEPEGLDGGRFQRLSVQAMAAHYIAEIRKVQPTGPYYIGGYCFGGLVAHEMAHQLRAQGERTPLVALFSAQLRFNRAVPIPSSKEETTASQRTGKEKLQRLLRSPAATVIWRMRRLGFAARSRLHKLTCNVLLDLGFKVPRAMRTLYVARTLGAVERAYKPLRFAGKLVLFCGRGEREQDPDLGWGYLAQHFEICDIGTGGRDDRREIMNEPLVRQLAQELMERMHSAIKAPSTRHAPDVTPASIPAVRARSASLSIVRP
jgi:amino acid adenylation domain-containing protein